MMKRAMAFDMKVEFIPIGEDEVGAWCAGVSLLLQLFQEAQSKVMRMYHWVGGA
jgi:hypothetical protein